MRFDCRNFASRKFASWMLSAALLSSSLIAQNRSGGDGGNRGSGSSSSNDGESSAISQQFRDLIISLVKNPPKPGSLGGGMFGFFIEDAVRSERSSRCGRPFGISNNVFRPSTDRRVDTFFDRSDVRSSTGLFNWVATVLKLTDLNPALPSGVLWLLAYINSFAAFGNGNSLLDMTGAIAADGSFSGMGTGKIFGTVDVKATAAFTPMMQMPGFFGFPNGSYTLSGTLYKSLITFANK